MDKTWGAVHETDFLTECHSLVKLAVVQLLGGMPLDDAGTRDLNEIMDYFIRRNSTGEIPTFNKEDARMIKKMTPFCKRMIEWNKKDGNSENTNANKKYGLVANMLKTGKYEDWEIINIFINLVVAGGETPALVCCKALAAMIANPDVMAKAVNEIDDVVGEGDLDANHLPELEYLDCCIKEGLRRYAPATVVGRSVKEPVTLCGYQIPAGASLHVNIHAVQMDPRIWPNPEKFDPTRHEKGNDNHEYGYIAFGAGSRGCPGKRAYYMLAKALLGSILKRYKAEATYRGNENNGVDLDTFLPNRFVAWDTNGIKIKFTRRS